MQLTLVGQAGKSVERQGPSKLREEVHVLAGSGQVNVALPVLLSALGQ